MPSKLFFSFILLLSGLSGISYEILYGRILGSLLGDQFAVSASVLITFLLGIGIGSRYAHYFWRWLWAIEGAIGVYGILFALNLESVDRLIYSGSVLIPGLAGSILLGTLLLLVPALLIGCSVPLFAGYLGRMDGDRVFSRVYALYNIGAAATALLIEFWLIRKFGITGTVMVFGAVNLLAAALLLLMTKSIAAQAPEKMASVVALPRHLVISLVMVSMASAVFQLFMVKIVEMMFGPFRESFALVLAIILFGISFGSFLVRRMRITYTSLLVANGVGLLLLLLLFAPLMALYAELYAVAAESGSAVLFLKGAMLVVLMGIPAITFGATIPALLNASEKNVAAESGMLLFIASLANVAGFLLMALVLHQYLDYGVQLLVVAGLVVLGLLIYQRKRLVAGFAVAVMLFTVAVHHWRWDEDLLYLSYTSFQSAKDMKDDREKFNFPDKFKGYQDVFSINWIDGAPYFFINGYISFPMNNPSEKIVGTIGSMFAPRAQESLVLGLGAGSTASAVGLLFDHTDVVEINPVVRANQSRMVKWNFDIEHNPKVNIIVDDAIHYAKTSTKQYDMILNTVTSPLYFSSAKLYTKDFFTVIKRRLKNDGVYVTWMDSRIGSHGTEIVVNTLKQNFKHCAILFIKSGYFLLIASDDPVKLQHANLADRGMALKNELIGDHERIPRLLAYNLMSPDVFPLVDDAAAPINTIDRPELEFEIARMKKEGLKEFRQKLIGAFDFDDTRQVIEPAMHYDAAEHVAHVRKLLKDSTITDGWNQMGAVYIRNFEQQVSEAELRMAREMAASMNDAKSHHGLGYALMKRKHYDEAIAEFKTALQMEPAHKNSQFNIASCYEHQEKHDAAIAAFKIAGAQNPKDAEIPYRIAEIYLKQKKLEQALAEIDRSLAMQQEDEFSHLRRGKILEAMGRKDEAVKAYSAAFNLNQKNEEVQAALNRHLAKW
jgi:predicted membrane-bound spermidine synthase/Flp pilus assembly protein TadD